MRYDMANLVGTKGQLVIEKEIRDRLGIKPGSVAIQRIVDGHVEIHFLPAEHNESVAGILAPFIKKDWPPEQVDNTEEAWAQAIREDWLLDEEANSVASE